MTLLIYLLMPDAFTSIGDRSVCVLDPYPAANKLQLKRASARRVGSTYAPDFLGAHLNTLY